MNHSKNTVWRLRKGMDRRFRSGHPWVYSNELVESPKGLEPGSAVELRDHSGKFLARGYGNPQSLIAFRALTRDPEWVEPTSGLFLVESLSKAQNLRHQMGLGNVSYRLCFGEADGLPGLIVDRYRTLEGQVFVVQAHTAGANRWISQIEEALKDVVLTSTANQNIWDQTSIVIRNDLAVRKLEGIESESPRVIRQGRGMDLEKVRSSKILVASALGGEPIEFHVNLLEGQKTGFFLDQAANIELTALRFRHLQLSQMRILDLCCYVGQWGTQLAKVFQNQGIQVSVLAVDASSNALELAKRNISSQGAVCETFQADVLRDLSQLSGESFDLVISDPPALIKNRKDIPAGTHAYLQLATQAFRLVKVGGGIVCCSCSSLLSEDSFAQMLAKGAQRNSRTVRWVGRGGQSSDHPYRLEFPEGCYLKGWVGSVV